MALINPKTMTNDQRDVFISGWVAAGGYMGDYEDGHSNSDYLLGRRPEGNSITAHWCEPWLYNESIDVPDGNYYVAGAEYWRKMGNMVRLIVELYSIDIDQWHGR